MRHGISEDRVTNKCHTDKFLKGKHGMAHCGKDFRIYPADSKETKSI